MQVKHYLELAELHRTVLQYAAIELDVLLQEEAFRAYATHSKIPKDSKFRCATHVFTPTASHPQLFAVQ
jgi:hypothetical protein